MHQPHGDPPASPAPAAFSDDLVARLARARRVGVLTGAGISAESGVPTFRDPGGLWEQFRPEELANVEAFLANPVLVQGWYAHRRAVVERAAPNPGHAALAELERLVVGRGGAFLLATQNVDGLHERAGSGAAGRLVELHGSLRRSYCVGCGREASEAELSAVEGGEAARCPACGALLRPDVVWFGEMLPDEPLAAATRAAETADVYLSVGTSGAVYPAAGLPLLAKARGAYVAEVNPERSEIARRLDEHVRGRAGEVLPALVARVRALADETP
jgi:NAD-dependent deacetylase